MSQSSPHVTPADHPKSAQHRRRTITATVVAVAAAAVIAMVLWAGAGAVARVQQLPADAAFDYQIGGDYTPRSGTRVVSRDWFAGSPLRGGYSICYVNAFQTQADEAGVTRPDEQSAWPQDLVLTALGDDPEWGGEYLVDLSTSAKRTRAAQWVEQMTDGCQRKGFQAVEFDNLDSWTRFDGTPLQADVPFGKAQAIAYAELITDYAHRRGLAVGQKNTSDLGRAASLDVIGFDFAVVEQCGEYDECDAFTAVFGDKVVAIEYTDAGFRRACAGVGADIAVVRRDVEVTTPSSTAYRFARC